MAQMYPETETDEEALIGEASHEIGAELINYAARGVTSTTFSEYDGEIASNGIVFTKPMFDGAKMYADDVTNVMREYGIFGGDCFGNEMQVHATRIHELSYGTTDQFIFARHAGHLYVWDYKFGFELVEAYENWQTMNYVEGIIERFNIDGIEDQNITVHIRIIQPRAFHRDGPIREWAVKLCDLRGYFNQLHDAAHESLGNDSKLRTGSHCKYCQARHACQPFLKAGMSLLELCGKPVPIDLSPEALGVQLAIVNRGYELLKSLKTAYDEQVKLTVKRGAVIPNFMVEMGYGNLEWLIPVDGVIQLGIEKGIDLKKPDAVKTPTQSKALGIDAETIEVYSARSKTGLKVVPDNGSKALQIFSSK